MKVGSGDSGQHPVSSVRGRWQRPALRAAALTAGMLATLSLLAPEALARPLAISSIVVVSVTPILRVLWLALRWAQERDWAFSAAALAVLAIIGFGAVFAAANSR